MQNGAEKRWNQGCHIGCKKWFLITCKFRLELRHKIICKCGHKMRQKRWKFGWWKRCKTGHQKNAKLDEKVGVNNGATLDTSRHKKMVQKGA